MTTAKACANIALVKYWGKRDATLNLPAAGSLSLTLDALTTTTRVEFDDALTSDALSINGSPADATRLTNWLDLVRARAGIRSRARVKSHNNFPTASGLASSASAYAALAVAASDAAGLTLNERELSVLARRGSGSAARSIFGGLVEMNPGEQADGSDAYASPLAFDAQWPLAMVVGVVGGGVAKKQSSRDAMQLCADTSPLYQGWLNSVPGDIAAAKRAIADRDLEALGSVAEASALAMHAAAIASRPTVMYWQAPTLGCMQAIRELRESGVPAFFTMDAGPHVKVLTEATHVPAVWAALAQIPGVSNVLTSGVGGPATIVADELLPTPVGEARVSG